MPTKYSYQLAARGKKMRRRVRKPKFVLRRLPRSRVPSRRLVYKSSPFPPALYTKMKYTDYLRVTTSLSGTSTAVLNLNDTYDTVASGWSINGQPFFHDQLLSANGPYYKNTVYGAKVKLTITNNSSSGAACCLVNWAPQNQYSSPTSPTAMVQYSGEANNTFYPNIGVNGNTTCQRVFKKYFDISKEIGITRNELFADDRYSGSYGTSPVFLFGMQIVSSNDPTSASSSSDVGYVVNVTYYVKCWSLSPIIPAS